MEEYAKILMNRLDLDRRMYMYAPPGTRGLLSWVFLIDTGCPSNLKRTPPKQLLPSNKTRLNLEKDPFVLKKHAPKSQWML